MTLESGLRNYFLDDSDVLETIGQRMFPHEAPENATRPYLAFRLTQDEEPRDLSGNVLSKKLGYEIACCDSTFDGAKALSTFVKDAIPAAGVQTNLDGTDVIMFWDKSPENDGHVTAQDKIRYQVLLDLMILVK